MAVGCFLLGLILGAGLMALAFLDSQHWCRWCRREAVITEAEQDIAAIAEHTQNLIIQEAQRHQPRPPARPSRAAGTRAPGTTPR